jgi:hypothetical protein
MEVMAAWVARRRTILVALTGSIVSRVLTDVEEAD